jgi:hypothetical protein
MDRNNDGFLTIDEVMRAQPKGGTRGGRGGPTGTVGGGTPMGGNWAQAIMDQQRGPGTGQDRSMGRGRGRNINFGPQGGTDQQGPGTGQDRSMMRGRGRNGGTDEQGQSNTGRGRRGRQRN